MGRVRIGVFWRTLWVFVIWRGRSYFSKDRRVVDGRLRVVLDFVVLGLGRVGDGRFCVSGVLGRVGDGYV